MTIRSKQPGQRVQSPLTCPHTRCPKLCPIPHFYFALLLLLVALAIARKWEKETRKGKKNLVVVRSRFIVESQYRFIINNKKVCHRRKRNLSRKVMRNWEVWNTNIQKSNNHRMIQELIFHTAQTTTSTEDLDPRPLTNNDHVSKMFSDGRQLSFYCRITIL